MSWIIVADFNRDVSVVSSSTVSVLLRVTYKFNCSCPSKWLIAFLHRTVPYMPCIVICDHVQRIRNLGCMKLELCHCTTELKGFSGEGALGSVSHSYQPPSTDARGPSVAWRFYTSWFSAAWKWLMPTVITLLLGSRSCFSLVIAWTLSLLHCNFCLRLVLRPGDSWAPGVSLALLAAEGGGLLRLRSVEGAPTACGMQCGECWMRGLPKGRKGGVEERGGGGGWGGDLWTVPSGSYDSIFNLGSKTEDKEMETEGGNKEIGWKDDALVWGPER